MNRATFFAAVRTAVFGGKMTASQVSGTETLLDVFEGAGWPVAHAAYALATAYHETAATMQPIAEYGKGKGKTYGQPDPLTKQTYYGRGYVQLTWLANYQKAETLLGFELVNKPDLAMEPRIAAAIMVRGMAEGWFTGKANRHYLDKTPPDYLGARRIINGTDKAALIAGYAVEFEKALRNADYGGAQSAVGIPIAEQNQRVGAVPATYAKNASVQPPVLGPDPSNPPAVIVSDEPIKPPGFWSSLAALIASAFKRK